MVKVAQPRWFMIGGLTFGALMTLLQRLTAPALGFSEHTDGFNAVVLVWWLLGGLVFMVGLVLTVLAEVGHRRGRASA